MIRGILTTEKATMMVEKGILVIYTDINDTKEEIRRMAEEFFGAKPKAVRTLIRQYRKRPLKIAYLRMSSPEEVREILTKMGVA